MPVSSGKSLFLPSEMLALTAHLRCTNSSVNSSLKSNQARLILASFLADSNLAVTKPTKENIRMLWNSQNTVLKKYEVLQEATDRKLCCPFHVLINAHSSL